MDLNLKMEEEIQIEDELLSVKILETLKLKDKQQTLQFEEKLQNLQIEEKLQNLQIEEKLQNLQIEEKLQNLQIEENENLLLSNPRERFTVIRLREEKRKETLLLQKTPSFSVKMDSIVEGLEEKVSVKMDSPVEGLKEKVFIELEECAFSTYAFLMDNEKSKLE